MSAENKGVAVVTGGTRGIGLAITKRLISDGFRVAAIYHGNEQAAQDCERETGAKAYKLDVTNRADCLSVCAQIEAEMGPISVLVNNAGITKDKFMHKMTEDDWNVVIATNLTSCFNMCQAVINGMRARNYGRIVNISSVNGQKGQIAQTNYAAAKAGMIGFSKALALESISKGITVNVVCPGYIETDMTAKVPKNVMDDIIKTIPAGRLGKPEEVADEVAKLVSSGTFRTGDVVSMNGGQYMP